MKTLKKLAKEFYIPLTLSISWVIYNIYGDTTNSQWSIQKITNVFGPTFFILSWLTGQFFRVKKQSQVESSFESMEKRFEELLNRVEESANEMIGHISGGSNFPCIYYTSYDMTTDTGGLALMTNGKYPLYDVSLRIVDVQKFLKSKDNPNDPSMESRELSITHINVGNVTPEAMIDLQSWKLESHPEQTYNIFISARNGYFIQTLRLLKIDGSWHSATQIMNRERATIFEEASDKFPRDSEGKLFWEQY